MIHATSGCARLSIKTLLSSWSIYWINLRPSCETHALTCRLHFRQRRKKSLLFEEPLLLAAAAAVSPTFGALSRPNSLCQMRLERGERGEIPAWRWFCVLARTNVDHQSEGFRPNDVCSLRSKGPHVRCILVRHSHNSLLAVAGTYQVISHSCSLFHPWHLLPPLSRIKTRH